MNHVAADVREAQTFRHEIQMEPPYVGCYRFFEAALAGSWPDLDEVEARRVGGVGVRHEVNWRVRRTHGV